MRAEPQLAAHRAQQPPVGQLRGVGPGAHVSEARLVHESVLGKEGLAPQFGQLRRVLAQPQRSIESASSFGRTVQQRVRDDAAS
ncbi:hypothetical protein ACZ91_38145 [Streptomyces regensis]|nr:hypothetical protein ACZ91_38145 [Streptomyces regensis]